MYSLREGLGKMSHLDSDLTFKGLPGGSGGKESARSARDWSSIPGSGRCPGEGIATHSSVPASEIPWAEEPGGLQSIGSQRVRHD